MERTEKEQRKGEQDVVSVDSVGSNVLFSAFISNDIHSLTICKLSESKCFLTYMADIGTPKLPKRRRMQVSHRGLSRLLPVSALSYFSLKPLHRFPSCENVEYTRRHSM